MRSASRHTARGGFSLVEVLIAVTLLSLVALGLASSATLGLSQVEKARQDLIYSADVQQVADSLIATGYAGVTAGSETLRGRPISWTVSDLSSTSRQIEMFVQRRALANTSVVYQDTVRLYLAKP